VIGVRSPRFDVDQVDQPEVTIATAKAPSAAFRAPGDVRGGVQIENQRTVNMDNSLALVKESRR
jgi:hypothetical protein